MIPLIQAIEAGDNANRGRSKVTKINLEVCENPSIAMTKGISTSNQGNKGEFWYKDGEDQNVWGGQMSHH